MGSFFKESTGVLVADPETSYLLLEGGDTLGVGQMVRAAGLAEGVLEHDELKALEHAHIPYPHHYRRAVDAWKQAGCPYPPVYRMRFEVMVEALPPEEAARFWKQLADRRREEDLGSEEDRAARGCVCDCDYPPRPSYCDCPCHPAWP